MGELFQSTPGINAGRITEYFAHSVWRSEFQSTPGINAGRILSMEPLLGPVNLFQSTPGINAGRIPGCKFDYCMVLVSIHARH